MTHILLQCDSKGDVVDAFYFCSDWCHRVFCREHNFEYEGWNGCHEIEQPSKCANCLVQLSHINPTKGEHHA